MHLHEFVRSEGEPRWTAVVDAVLGGAVVVWVVVLSVLEPVHMLRVAVPLALAVVVVVRVLALVEHSHERHEAGHDEAPADVPAHSDVDVAAHAA